MNTQIGLMNACIGHREHQDRSPTLRAWKERFELEVATRWLEILQRLVGRDQVRQDGAHRTVTSSSPAHIGRRGCSKPDDNAVSDAQLEICVYLARDQIRAFPNDMP